jgi:hypothetical protein
VLNENKSIKKIPAAVFAKTSIAVFKASLPTFKFKLKNSNSKNELDGVIIMIIKALNTNKNNVLAQINLKKLKILKLLE